MEEVSTIGVDLAKNVFQLRGASADRRFCCHAEIARLEAITMAVNANLIGD
jgi:hypothetical protein